MRLGDAVDSMGLVEFVGILADDFGVSPEMIDEAVGRKYGTIAEVASALQTAGLVSTAVPMKDKSYRDQASRVASAPGAAHREIKNALGWLAATTACLPDKIQSAAEINNILGRPPGWLESHAGIKQRRVWGSQDAVAAAY